MICYYNGWDVEKVNKFVDDHVTMKHYDIYNDLNGYKRRFEDGSTYEWRYTEWSVNHFATEIKINDTVVYTRTTKH